MQSRWLAQSLYGASMTKRELIAALAVVPDDAEVSVEDNAWGCMQIDSVHTEQLSDGELVAVIVVKD